MGRASEYTNSQKAAAVAALRAGESGYEVASGLGCSSAAIYRWAKDPQFSEAKLAKLTKGNGHALPESHALNPLPAEPVPAPIPLPPVESMIETLRDTVQRLEARLQFLRSETAEIEKLLPRVQSALTALQET